MTLWVEPEHQGTVPLEATAIEVDGPTATPWVTQGQLETWLNDISYADRNSEYALRGFTILSEPEGLLVRIGDGEDGDDALAPLVGEDSRGIRLYALSDWGNFVPSDEEVV